MRRTPGVMALYALVAVFLVGATSAFVFMNKSVTISVDGKPQQVTTFAGTVGQALRVADVSYDRRDLVVPAPDESLDGDTRIVVTHARKLRLTVDGRTSTMWVTANTVRQALQQIDGASRGAVVSVSRSHRLPLSGFSFTVRNPRSVTVAVGGAKLRVRSTASTVRELLANVGIELGPHDTVNAKLGKRPKDGQVVKIRQVVGNPETRTVKIDFETERKADPDMFKGEEKVVQKGRKGIKHRIVATVVNDEGDTVEKVVASDVTRKPRKKIVHYGTKERPTPDDADIPSGADGLNWQALAECESGGNPNAVNSAGPYYGLYQFSASTWHSVGGEGVPTDASATEQTRLAQELYQRSGDGQWPVCGEHLYD